MRQATYLNVILTVNAVLLAAVMWTQVSVQSLSPAAHAQSGQGTPGGGVPNAADQRQRMIESLREIHSSVEATRRLVESGRVKVEVTNIDRLRDDRPR
jgi:hypothetical protein